MIAAITISAAVAFAATGEDPAFKLLSRGAMEKIGYYMPQKIDLTAEKPAAVTKVPDGLASPMFGVIPVAGENAKAFHILVDQPQGGAARLIADTNGNGDFTDDAAGEWTATPREQPDGTTLTMHTGGAMFNLGTAEAPFEVRLAMYRFDPNDPRRQNLKNSILYYRDYVVEGSIALGDKTYTVMLDDERTTGDFRGQDGEESGVSLLVDVNGNGRIDSRGEKFDVRKPFNIGGTTWQLTDIARNGLSMKVAKSDVTVEEVPTPPDHSLGKAITAFEATTMDGKAVKFPQDYKGKVVMLDFWATWCGPCIRELPHVTAAYQKFHDQGFEILGISLDSENATDEIKKMMADKNMTWPQVYDGGGWKARIAQLYAIEGIPAVFLVDGDTGKIIATEGQLRGKNLEPTVAAALEARKK